MNPVFGHTLGVCVLLLAPLCPGCADATVAGGPFVGIDAGAGTPLPGDLRTIVPGSGARIVVDPFEGSCAHTSIRAQSLPLDLVMMVDTSGSMNDQTTSGETKWEAVKDAFASFFRGSGAGLGVGMHFFPVFNTGVPTECRTDAACGAFGPCRIQKACTDVNQYIPCEQNSDCPFASTCVPLGQCSASNLICAPIGVSCGGIDGDCTALPGRCLARDQCNAATYATPAVAIATLPAAATALVSAMANKTPEGSTPTGPALQGAVAQARLRAIASPSRRVAVVLATDGFPTSCEPRSIGEIAAVAADARAGTPSVATFVIGVFAPSEETAARSNLNSIAAAGGSNQAFIVNTGGNVGQAFLTALNDIRAAAIACEYQLPPDMFGQIDYGQVNVLHTTSRNQTSTIGAVANLAACDPQKGGWYYDADPATGATPTLVSACPATCTALRADRGGRVDLVFGCKTIFVD